MNSQISAVIITKNEEHNIERCLRSLDSIADEVIVVDSGSKDSTTSIAEKLGATVIQTEWLGYSATKNLGNQKALHSYIISIDADEELSPKLLQSISEAKKKGLKGTYSMSRLTNYCGKWIKHLGWYPDEKIRIFDKREVKWVGEFVHEELDIPASSENQKLDGDINHYSYIDAIDHRTRADKYSTLTAQKLFHQEKKASIIKPALSAVSRFVKMYFIKLGFLDGNAGLKISLISAASNAFKYRELRRLHLLKALQPKLKNICISRTDSIGDVMLTLPLMGQIKKNYPNSKVIFLGKNYTRALAENCAHIDTFVSIDDINKLENTERINAIKDLKLDAVIHVLASKHLATLFQSAKVKFRLGSARKLFNITRCNALVNYSRKKSNLHESQLNIKMLSRLGCSTNLEIDNVIDSHGFSAPRKSFDLIKNNSNPQVILHPKSQGSAPEWATENFYSLAQKLSQKGITVFITGTEKEGDLVKPNFTFTPSIIDCTGIFTLEEYISFISQTDGLVAASTGPTHISAALNQNTLGLYTVTRPAHAGRWGPLGENAHTISNSSENGLLQIEVEEVYQRILAMIGSSEQK